MIEPDPQWAQFIGAWFFGWLAGGIFSIVSGRYRQMLSDAWLFAYALSTIDFIASVWK